MGHQIQINITNLFGITERRRMRPTAGTNSQYTLLEQPGAIACLQQEESIIGQWRLNKLFRSPKLDPITAHPHGHSPGTAHEGAEESWLDQISYTANSSSYEPGKLLQPIPNQEGAYCFAQLLRKSKIKLNHQCGESPKPVVARGGQKQNQGKQRIGENYSHHRAQCFKQKMKCLTPPRGSVVRERRQQFKEIWPRTTCKSMKQSIKQLKSLHISQAVSEKVQLEMHRNADNPGAKPNHQPSVKASPRGVQNQTGLGRIPDFLLSIIST